MRSFRSQRFRKLFDDLPATVQQQARDAYEIWRQNPHRPSLSFKQIDPSDSSVYSVRIGRSYRAIGYFEPDGDFVWHWIGSHSDYDKLV